MHVSSLTLRVPEPRWRPSEGHYGADIICFFLTWCLSQIQIHHQYLNHLTTRFANQKALFLSPSYPGVNVDLTLTHLLVQDADTAAQQLEYVPKGSSLCCEDQWSSKSDRRVDDLRLGDLNPNTDARINLVFWARPPTRIKALVIECQRHLQAVLSSEHILRYRYGL